MEIKHWEMRNSDIALCEIKQEYESQRLQQQQQQQQQQANQCAGQAQRKRMSLYGELEMRKRLLREHPAKDCQEIEELKRTCCEEIGPARQAGIDELSMQQERNPTTVGPLLAQIQD